MFRREAVKKRPRAMRVALALLWALDLFLAAPAGAQVDAPTTTAPESGAPSGPGDAFKPIGPQLFPLYQHYLRTADATTVRNVLYLYTSTEGAAGSWSRLVVPAFYVEHLVDPPQERFFLFPLLFFHKSSEAESYNYSLPFFYDHRTPDTSTQALFPFWLHRATAERKLSRHNVLFPLFRYSYDEREEDRPVHSSRFGLWTLLELFESRTQEGSADYRAFNFFNWKEETAGGLPLYSYSWQRHEGEWFGKTNLFPFYWSEREPGWENLVVFPFWWKGDGLRGSHLWAVPFFGHRTSPGSYDYFFIPLLSGWGRGPGEARRSAVLFPLYYRSADTHSLATGSLPLFDYRRDEESTRLGILLWLYRTERHAESGKRTHSVLYPFANFDVEPDGSRGSRWLFPYIETFNEERLWRIVAPLYLERQTLAGGETDSFFRLGIPLYLSFGQPTDYFSLGFPLYWASRTGPRGWQTFLPFFYHSYSAAARGLHVFPFFGHRRFPSREQMYLGGPLYVREQSYDIDRNLVSTGNYFLWPLTGVVRGESSYHYRLLPLFWASGDGEDRDLLLTPLYYQQQGPSGTQHYVFPFYGRYQTERLTRELYAAGSYIHTEARNERGEAAYRRRDFLWMLAASEENLEAGAKHQHILPLGFWRTTTQPADRTVAGPFYYSHRITDGDEEHRLRLVLGNLYLSKEVREEGRSLSSDEGILWPLTRRFKSAESDRCGTWAAPFYFDFEDRFGKSTALWPLYFRQQDHQRYSPSYWRYFFLFDRETWPNGHRFSLGQVLFDWMEEKNEALNKESRRWRLLYPLIEHERTEEGYRFSLLDPLVHSASHEGRGERFETHRVFPFYWQGNRERQTATGDWRPEESHFFLLPFFGVHDRRTRADYHVLFPLFHLVRSRESVDFELWPLLFSRNQPSLRATRLWPLYAGEEGEEAGEFWVSRYLFLAKRFAGPRKSSFRLEPFLAAASEERDGDGNPISSHTNALFYLYLHDRDQQGSWFHALPLVLGGSDEKGAFASVLPLHYWRDFGAEKIDYFTPWRFFFLSDHLRGGDGERHTGVLWKLFEHTHNVNDPDFHETRFLHEIFLDRRTSTSRQFALNPFFQYYQNDADEETQYSFLLSLYQYRVRQGEATHTLFYFLDF
jgi:hypothetical protein